MKIDWSRCLLVTDDNKPIMTFENILGLASSNLNTPLIEKAKELKLFIEKEARKLGKI